MFQDISLTFEENYRSARDTHLYVATLIVVGFVLVLVVVVAVVYGGGHSEAAFEWHSTLKALRPWSHVMSNSARHSPPHPRPAASPACGKLWCVKSDHVANELTTEVVKQHLQANLHPLSRYYLSSLNDPPSIHLSFGKQDAQWCHTGIVA